MISPAKELRIAAIGECMIELANVDSTLWRQGFAGDTANTATYLARLLAPKSGRVDYVTAIGDDPFSMAMLDAWHAEDIRTEFVQNLPGRLPGLYAIRTDVDGERHFFYWRDQAAARSMMQAPESIAAAIASASAVYVSGITLAILNEADREALLTCLRDASQVVFDPNYRPKLWPDPSVARTIFQEIMAMSAAALPTFDDEALLFGDTSPERTLERIAGYGVSEVVVKCGSGPCLVGDGNTISPIPAEAVGDIVDTTGAGDSFNAGYLASRLCGLDVVAAAQNGHRLAAQVVRHKGAIMPKAAMPEIGLAA